MKKSLRLLSLALSLVMLVCMIPLAAGAGTIINTIAIEDLAVPREGTVPGYYFDYDTNLVSQAYDMNDATTVNGIEWVDLNNPHSMTPQETYTGGHSYRVNIDVYANAGLRFDSEENLKVSVNGEAAKSISVYDKDIYGNGTHLWLCIDFDVQHEHQWEETIIDKASKEKSGFLTKKCSICGEETGLITISMVGDIELDEEVDLRGLSYTGKNHFPGVTVYDEYGNELAVVID